MNEVIDNQTSCHHDLMLRLTQVRDLTALNRTFIAIGRDMLPSHHFRLYEYNRQQHCWQPAHGLDECTDDWDILELMLKLEPVVLPAPEFDAYRNLFPIVSGRELLAGLVIAGEPLALERRMLQVLLDLYANQYFILSRNKRDGLTDLLNRQALNERLQRIYRDGCRQTRRAGEPEVAGWQIALLDIDHFKSINDGYGHLCGDEVLVNFAHIMHESFRDYDYLFRYGGEEFIVLLKNVDDDLAHMVLDRFRARVASTKFPRVSRVSVSIGHVRLNTALPANVNIGHADEALYAAKGAGRNQVCCYHQLRHSC